MERDIIGIAVVEINRLTKKKLNNRDFRKACRPILENLVQERLSRDVALINKLKAQVDDFIEVKRLLNKL